MQPQLYYQKNQTKFNNVMVKTNPIIKLEMEKQAEKNINEQPFTMYGSVIKQQHRE